MSQTNTNTNNGQNQNHLSGRGGRGQRGPNGSGRGNCYKGCGNNLITRYLFERKMKDGPIFKLTITKTGHRPTQFKKITDTLPVLCADKNFQELNEVLWTEHDIVETDFMPPYPDATHWSTTHHMQVSTINLLDVPLVDGSHLAHFLIMEQTHVFVTNLQKELLSE